MALDEALLRTANGPLLRIYRWERAAVSFGYFSKFQEVAAAWPGRELVRRWTGGGMVPHGEDLTYTLIVPQDCPVFAMGALESYRLIHECIANLLGSAGVLAEAAAEKVSDACFENPARHDVLYAGRKVAGAAQRRTKFGLLHQGSIQCGARDAFLRKQLPEALAAGLLSRELSRAEVLLAEQLVHDRYGAEIWTRRF
ncbi:MAG: lplA [Chthoniobacteraceae bacterium]|nr:lplA [Chthoniobacteraceae bacterium]